MTIDFGNITQIIVAIISLIGIIYSHRRTAKSSTPKETSNELESAVENVKKHNKKLLLLWIFISLTAINLIVFGFRYLSNDSTTIEIIYPQNGNIVSINENISGEQENILKDKIIWIIIYSLSYQKYFPNHSPAQINSNGTWTSLVSIGSSADKDEQFYILAYLLDNKTKIELEKEFNKTDFGGLDIIPKDAVLYHQITVIRK